MTDDAFEFRVSDSLVVPLRGQLLRLRLTRGRPAVAAVAAGARLRLQSPDGREREVRILDHSMTGGTVDQARLDRVRELDIIISAEDATRDDQAIGIGWTVHPAGNGR